MKLIWTLGVFAFICVAFVMITQFPQKKEHDSYALPPLPYAFNALEPHIDALTMEIHYTKHHQKYVNELNETLKGYPALADKPVGELLQNLKDIPQEIRKAVRNNGGGHYNHSLFWTVMSPQGGGKPTGDLAVLIDKQFGSFEAFKDKFSLAAKKVFGSGWAWLCLEPEGKLLIMTTQNQDSPISQGLVTLLCLDVWEHAYYLKYQNRRLDYITAWWNVVYWPQVEEYLRRAMVDERAPSPE